jgi:hypothetical protein
MSEKNEKWNSDENYTDYQSMTSSPSTIIHFLENKMIPLLKEPGKRNKSYVSKRN